MMKVFQRGLLSQRFFYLIILIMALFGKWLFFFGFFIWSNNQKFMFSEWLFQPAKKLDFYQN